jgi:hypothetical protein
MPLTGILLSLHLLNLGLLSSHTKKQQTYNIHPLFQLIYCVLSVLQVRWDILYQTSHHLGGVSDQRIVSTDRLT